MGLLADVYSYGDSMKRKVRGLLSDPLGTIEQGVRNFGEDQNQMLQTMQNAYPIPGNKMANFTPAQIDSFRRQLADQATAQGMAGMTVWHGSPHKFDRFDSSKIGTGEGAQAYGHGLYLAENPSVAREYQEKLSSTGSAKNLAAQYGDVDKGIAEAQRRIASYKQLIADGGGGAMDRARSMLRLSEKNLQDLSAMKAGLPENTGALYKVDLPDDQIAKMLDWDVPLNRQSDAVKAALEPLMPQIRKAAKTDESLGGYLGKGIYEMLGSGKASPQTAQMLKQQGIPGIRYLDDGSRGAGQGTSNFVIFPGNEGLLQILERNGAPL